MLTFKPLKKFQPGLVSRLLHESYAELLEKYPEPWMGESEKWGEFDKEAFEKIDTVGKCMLVTCLDGEAIGFSSYDPRKGPDWVIIGHNCIVPRYQGRGYGKAQVKHLLNLFMELGFKKVKVTTSEHPFFLQARRMYQACGFKEVRRFPGGPEPKYKIVELERKLSE